MQASLYGITRSNRDFSQPESWGKNQFNNSFPIALVCYMHSRNIAPKYLTLGQDNSVTHSTIGAETLFGIEPTNPNLFFAFESDFVPYQRFVDGGLARIDLVTQNSASEQSLRALEIKLTALPDNTTAELSDDRYGCELVVRPDTIVYQALSLMKSFGGKREQLKAFLEGACAHIVDWANIDDVGRQYPKIVQSIENILASPITNEEPLIMQPIWKTQGKSPKLSHHCLDVFVWSNKALTRLYINSVGEATALSSISRQQRTTIWLTKMLWDFAVHGMVHFENITRTLLYGTRNDKAFAIGGLATHPFMHSPELTKPRITKQEIRNIILGGGEKFLSPERRFDAIIFNSPDLFEEGA
ncbi:MAG: HindVP family restriction endonuclease [Candidatus Kapaibacteriota bacterium]